MSRKFLIFTGIIFGGCLLFIGAGIAQQIFPPRTPIAGKSIVYLADPAQVEPFVSVEKVTTTFNAALASSAEVTGQAVDGIIIHRSMMNQVDRNWLRSAYFSGTVIAGFNITGTEMANLVGSSCISEGNFSDTIPNYIIVSFSITGENPDEVNRVLNHRLQDCSGENPLEGIEGRVDVRSGRATDYFNGEGHFDQFSYVFNSYLNPDS